MYSVYELGKSCLDIGYHLNIFSFWHFWNKENSDLIGYRSGEGAGPDIIYMYYPLRGEHIETGSEDTRGLDFSPSMHRMMIIDTSGAITTCSMSCR